ncbi:MAG: hypothetical protein QXO64_07245 [Thermofilaceae archaeon]
MNKNRKHRAAMIPLGCNEAKGGGLGSVHSQGHLKSSTEVVVIDSGGNEGAELAEKDLLNGAGASARIAPHH